MKIKISDSQNNFLIVDLKDIVEAIGDVGNNYEWEISNLEITIDKSKRVSSALTDLLKKCNYMEGIEKSNWEVIVNLSEVVFQTINCTLEGKAGSETMRIDAIDSSYWEVEFTDLRFKQDFLKKFKQVEILYSDLES